MIGQMISHYRVIDKIGEGGMGIVYKAHDTLLDRIVALKFLPHYLTSDPSEKERFYHEARAASGLNHPNITTIYEIKEFDNQLYLAMEFVEGKTLKKMVEQETVSVKKVLDIAIQICDGLAAAADKSVVHRDIKSDNIMITPKGQVKIMDFGLAKVKGSTKLTKAGSTLGTAAYMSPEQAQGEEVDYRSDIFSFGVVFYEMLTGKLPFRGEHHAAIIYSLINEEPQPIARFNEKVTLEIERIAGKALAKDREERYQHADDMLADLRRERKNIEYTRAGYTAASTIPPAVQYTPPPPKRRQVFKYIIPAAAIVVLVWLFVIFNPFNLQIGTQKTTAGGKNSLAVMYFQNIPDPEDKDHTADMLADLLITSLSQAKDLEVISRERLFDIQKELKADSKSITPEMATKVAQRAGVTTMLMGSILQKEPELAVTTRLIDVKSGRIINSQRIAGFSIKQIFPLVDTLAILVRNNLNVITPASVEVKSVTEVTTSSPEAYRSYLEGVEYNNKYFIAEAKAAFQRAIELDSNFAMAYYGLATLNTTTGDMRQMIALEKAWQLRSKVTEREQLEIQGQYAGFIENNALKAAEIYETIVQKYPHEQSAYTGLAYAYLNTGEYEKVFQAAQSGLRNDSLDKNLWNSLAYMYAGMNQRGKAFETINRYCQLAPAEPNPYDSKGELYFVFGEIDSAIYWFQKAISFHSDFSSTEKLGNIALVRQDYETALKYYEKYGATSEQSQRATAEKDRLLIPAHQGRLKNMYQQLTKSVSSFKSEKLQVPPVISYYALIILSYELGEYPAMTEYSKQLSQLLKDSPDNIIGDGLLAWALTKNGNLNAASRIMDDLKKNRIGTSVPTQSGSDYTNAFIAYEEGKFDLAVENFNKAFQHLFPNHAPQLIYAVSLLKTGHIPEAMRELQRTVWWSPISYPPINLTFLPMQGYWPIASVKAHYWLGIAYEQQGKKDKAIEEYEKFLGIWKDADFKSAEMQDARIRLGKLKQSSMK